MRIAGWVFVVGFAALPRPAHAQAADWQAAVWREPQVRYLLADMTLGGNPELYRKYATEEKDPDSREAIRLWDAGSRVVNKDEFERKWVANPHGKDGRVMRVVFRGTNRTILGTEVVLTSDAGWEQAKVRLILADLTLGRPVEHYAPRKADPSVAEALRRWTDGVRAVGRYEAAGAARTVIHRGTTQPVDPARIALNSDVPYPETNVRYFMADIALGGSIEFYRKAAEAAHEMGCLEAVRRTEEGYTITNLDRFERKTVGGKVTITRKGSDERISGMEVRLSSDSAEPPAPKPDPKRDPNPAAPAPRPNDPAGHKLLVTLVRTGDTEIFVADPATGDLTNLTRSPATEDRYPCWSPDGKRVAFTRDRGEFKDLWVMDADGANQRVIVSGKFTCYMPSWQVTPGGERIVFGMHGAGPEMASARPDGTDLKVLGEGHDPTLSPDGTLVCYTGHPPEGGVTVYVMRWDGADRRRVVAGTSRVGATFPNWSPDGKRLVYSFPVGGALELFTINRDGTGEKQLTAFGGTAVCTPAAWSPDGKWISFRRTDERYWGDPARMKLVYETKPADKRPVWLVRPDGTGAHGVECLRFQCAIDGSRAAWKPTPLR